MGNHLLRLGLLVVLLLTACADSSNSTGTIDPADVEEYVQGGQEREVDPFTIGGVDGFYDGPIDADSGGTLKGRICVEGGLEGTEWFVTLGEPPGADEATHFAGKLDADGYMDFEIEVNWPSGIITKLYTSDGENVVEVTEIHIGG